MKVHDKVTASFQYLFLASKVFESSQQSLQKLSVFTSRSRSSNELLKVHNKSHRESQHNHKLSVFISHRSQHGLKVHKKVTWSCQYSFLDSQEVIQNSREGASSLTQKSSHVTTQYQSVYIKIFFVCPRKCLDYSWLDELPNPIILSKMQNKVSIHALFLLDIANPWFDGYWNFVRSFQLFLFPSSLCNCKLWWVCNLQISHASQLLLSWNFIEV